MAAKPAPRPAARAASAGCVAEQQFRAARAADQAGGEHAALPFAGQ